MMYKLVSAALLVAFVGNAYAQKDTSSVTVQVITEKDEKKVIVDAEGQKWTPIVQKRQKDINTTWLDHFDIGFSNFYDRTDYTSPQVQVLAPGSNEEWSELRAGKSINFNLWIFNQRVNLIKHVVNLKYAMGIELNNYYYRNPIRYSESQPLMIWDKTEGRSYHKSKLAADYITVPLMLNFALSPRKRNISIAVSRKNKAVYMGNGELGFSAGISAGYLYSARNKTVTSDEGKQKLKDNFNLNPWKLSYVAEINLGYFSLYGSYAMKSMFKNGLDMTPYSVGIRF
ncbi:hypothetical protein ABDK00_002705 [Niabella insulamsoli]|uniref:hypothetical protein n=1 Tax=Niabella insulamsoli TaxID=3144874 RepID=UPI0031FDF746